MTPMQIYDLALGDLRTTTDLLEDHDDHDGIQTILSRSTSKIVKVVKSWLIHFDIEIRRKIRITNLRQTPTLHN